MRVASRPKRITFSILAVVLLAVAVYIAFTLVAFREDASAKKWMDRHTGDRLHMGKRVRMKSADGVDALARQIVDGTQVEDRETRRIHLWLEADDGRQASAENGGQVWNRLAQNPDPDDSRH